MLLILFSLWAGIVAMLAIPAVSHNWPVVARNLSSVSYIPQLTIFMGNWMNGLAGILVFIAFFVIAEQCGGSLFYWLGARRRGIQGKWYFRYPIGYGVVSILVLGLLLTGLWFPSVVIAAPVIVFAINSRRVKLISLGDIRAEITALFSSWDKTCWSVIVLGFLAMPALVTPEITHDAWEFYLDGPGRWLAAHGFASRGGTPPLHYPFLAELPYIYGLIIGNDSIVKLLNVSVFLCGVVAAFQRYGDKARLWILLLLATSSTGIYLCTSGKNEGFLAGIILLLWVSSANPGRFWMLLGGLYLGMSLSVKYIAVFGFAWIPVVLMLRKVPRSIRWFAGCSYIGLIIFIPWCLKSWLLTGDPLFPFIGQLFPQVVGWDEVSGLYWKYSFMKYAGEGSILSFIPFTFIKENPLIAALIPYLLWKKGESRLIVGTVVCVAWMLGIFFAGPEFHRWIYPLMAIVFIQSGIVLAMLTDTYPKMAILIWLLAGFSFFVSWTGLLGYGNPYPFILGSSGAREYREYGFGELVRTHERISQHNIHNRTIILSGENRGYRFPGHIWLSSTRASGQPPLFWILSRNSQTEEDIIRHLRQINAEWLVYNPYLAMRFADAEARYSWAPRQLALWGGYFRKHAELVEYPKEADQDNGVYYIYRLHRKAIPESRRLNLHLPGTESLVSSDYDRAVTASGKLDAKKFRDAVEGVLPGIIQYKNSIGGVAMQMGDYQTAYEMFRPGIKAGAIDAWNLYRFGISAFRSGKWRDSISGMEKAYEAYPDRRRQVLAMYCRIAFVGALQGGGMSFPERISVLEDCIRAVYASGNRRTYKREVGLLRLAKVQLLMASGQGMAAGMEYEGYQKENYRDGGPTFNELPAYLSAAAMEASVSVH